MLYRFYCICINIFQSYAAVEFDFNYNRELAYLLVYNDSFAQQQRNLGKLLSFNWLQLS